MIKELNDRAASASCGFLACALLSLTVKADTMTRFNYLMAIGSGITIAHISLKFQELSEELTEVSVAPSRSVAQQTVEATVVTAVEPTFYSPAKDAPKAQPKAAVEDEDLWADPPVLVVAGPTLENWMMGD